MTPKHDVSVVYEGTDKTTVTIYTEGDDPSFSMSFESIAEVEAWRDHITLQILRAMVEATKAEKLEAMIKAKEAAGYAVEIKTMDTAEECDHEWEVVDDSFDHALGCEQIMYQRCAVCDEEREYDPPRFDDDVI